MSKKNNGKKRKHVKLKYRSFLILMVSLVLIASIALVAIGSWIFVKTGIVPKSSISDGGYLIILLIAASIIIAIGLSFLVGKLILRPVNILIKGLNSLAKGKFETRINISSHTELSKLSDSFNTLANELSHTEIMRSDFINNFSHEFKTPLVSVKGLVALLKNNNLPEEKRIQYISVIEDELDRLTTMSTSILQLSKIENQVILTDVKNFNLSEQIRMCIILLEKKWEKKNLELLLEIEDIEYKGNEDLLKEVWLNLIDNAIKFSYPDTLLGVNVKKEQDFIVISISDEGIKINEEDKTAIFNKFFRTEQSSSTDGHGIGLSIVSHIIKLHKGEIFAESIDNITTFTVKLPL